MTPIVALVAGSYVVALERWQSGIVEEQKASNDSFLDICRCVQSFITNNVMTDNAVQQRFLDHCTLIVLHSHSDMQL